MSFFGSRRQTEPEPQTPVERERTQPPLQPQIAAPQAVGFESVLGANCVLEGKLTSTANVRLDGSFTGTLEITGNILVGETAKINADINAKNISIAGAVRGNVNGKKVQLLRTGRVWGDITATALTTEEGAFIDGKISMVSHEASGMNSKAVTEPTVPKVEAPVIPIEPAQEPETKEADPADSDTDAEETL